MSSRNHFRNLGPIEELGSLIDSMVSHVEDDFQAALNDFQDLAESILSTDPNDYFTVNDSLLTLIEVAIENNENLADQLSGAFQSWADHLQDNLDATADLLSRLYDMFSDQLEVFRILLDALVGALSDFPGLFHQLCKRIAAQSSFYLDGLEQLMLPLFYAGISVFGAEQGVKAVKNVLTDSSSVFSSRVACDDLGLIADNLPELQLNLLDSPTFRLPRGVWMIAGMIDALRQASSYSNLLPQPIDIPNPFLQTVLGPVAGVIAQAISDYLNNIDALLDELIARLLEQAENDFEIEWLVLQLARFTPVGLLFVLIGTSVKLFTSPAPWFELLLNPIEDNPDLNVLRLDGPSQSNKYILFSDIHRDAASDQRPPYQFGSIDHFMPNRGQYLELLKHYADIPEYTVIEIGDCEELWFHRDFSQTPTQKMQEIVQTHAEIYALLSDLHAQGRYVRIQGNHDSYLQDTETFNVLRDAIESDGSEPFEIYDFAIIEGVKTMQDVPIWLGLDSDPNSERKPMLLAHGHQWDFWNCEANNILGKMIVSAVVTPLDMLDDPLRDLAGLSRNGSPLVNFKQILGNLPVFNSWQNYEPGVVRMDEIQHMDDQARRFTDDVMYSETMASLMGMLIPITPGPNDMDCGLLNLNGRCLFNLMTLGHTHNPHNEPYYDLKVLPYVKEVLVGLQDAIANATFGLFDVELGLVKSNYLNTGMTGWHEECIWAIDVGKESHGTGQPKLVNWTYNTRVDRPNHMDWELPHIPRDGGPTPGDQTEAYFRQLLAMLSDMVEEERDRLIEVLSQASLTPVVAAALKNWKPVDLAFSYAKGGAAESASALVFQCLIGIVSGKRGSFSVNVELPPALRKPFAQAMQPSRKDAGQSKRDSLTHAIASMAVIQQVARSGLSLELGPQPDPDGHRACLGLLFILAQLQQSKSSQFSVKLTSTKTSIGATVSLHGQKTPLLPDGPINTLPVARPGGQQRMGLVIDAYVSGLGTPLQGWNVALMSQNRKRPGRLMQARTNKQGRAELLRLQPRAGGYHLSGNAKLDAPPVIILYTPDGKEALRRQLDTERPVERLSLPVDFRILREIGFYRKSKIRSPSIKMRDLCDHWKKRLHDKRDEHAASDLCLNNMMLDLIGGLDNPKTPLQKQAARIFRQVTKDKKATKKVSELSGLAAKQLKQCLGNDYMECDADLSADKLGEKLLEENTRFRYLKNLFDDPVPDPLANLPDVRAGRGIGELIGFDKVCQARFESGELDQDIYDAMAGFYPEARVLAQPSINFIEVWDAGFGGGDIVRKSEVHDKVLNMRVLKNLAGDLSIAYRAVGMDVELDDETCLLIEADESGRQVLATDVIPGQRITLYGSGFVSDKARVQVDFRHWEPDFADGRLVPDTNVLPADGFYNLEAGVFGNYPEVNEDSDPEQYNGDKVVIEWPAAASKEGLYRLRLTFANESDYPTSFTQNPDCSIVVDRSDVHTQEVFFVVLPAVEEPAVRAMVEEVECIDLTDPESILGIPYPDELLLMGNAIMHRIEFSSTDNDFSQEISALAERVDDITLSFPSVWTPAMRLFPEQLNFDQLADFESVIVSFDLLEVEGEFDKFIAQLVYLAALVALVVIVAAVVTVITAAVILLLIGLGVITAGTAEAIALPIATAFLAAVYTFLFGAAFTAFLALQENLNAVVDGSDSIVKGQAQLDGARLKYRLSPVRFHRLMFPLDESQDDVSESLATLQEVFENDALGGSYEVLLNIETSDS